MWVYTGTTLEQRLKLHQALAFWLDYWLFLHGEGTHPFFCARPIGIRTIARAALASSAAHDATLRSQLKREIEALVRLSAYISNLPVAPDDPLDPNPSQWPPAWLVWCEKLLQEAIPERTLPSLITALVNALSRSSFREVAYYTRRISCELSDESWSPRQLFTAIKYTICDSGAFDGGELDLSMFEDLLTGLFRSRVNSPYEVTISLAPVSISRTILTAMYSERTLLVEVDADGNARLTGVTYRVDAAHPEIAVEQATNYVSTLLDALRLRFYIRTHVYGAAKVVDTRDSSETWISLPQPLWTKHGGRRGVPRLPAAFSSVVKKLPEGERSHWYAARWHLSQAFADWAEDPHGAATKCWQALEAFAPGHAKPLPRVVALLERYLAVEIPALCQHSAAHVTSQAIKLKQLFGPTGNQPDWHYWLSQRTSVDEWFNKVLIPKYLRASNYYETWRTPEAPTFLFDPDVGLLQVLYRRLRAPQQEKWMEYRLAADFALLYGLRNKVVHSGLRIFSRRTAAYLGQIAVEVVLALMTGASHKTDDAQASRGTEQVAG